MRSETLIATLGVKPSVVTLACDMLLAEGVNLAEVVVIHTAASQPPIRDALRALDAEFPGASRYAHADRAITYRTVEIRDDQGRAFDEALDEWQTGALYRTIYREIRRVKQQFRRVHLSIAGGRKSMSVYGMACAQLLFSADDRLWHLLSDPHIEASDALHCAPNEARLIRIPFLTLNSTPLYTLLTAGDPYRAALEQQAQAERIQKEQVRDFYEKELNSGEKAIVRTMMELYWQGTADVTSALIAQRTRYAKRTVDNMFRDIYDKLRNSQGTYLDQRPNRATLVAFIALYYSEEGKFA